MRKKGSRIGLIGCSNGQPNSDAAQIERLEEILTQMGFEVCEGDCIYETETRRERDGAKRGEALMKLYRDPEIEMIFDLSGGDLANEVLPYLDYEVIRSSGKTFWGYSDLTTVLNAIYAKTNCPSVLYQVKNLVWRNGELQQIFKESIFGEAESLFSFPYRFIQGECLEGVVVGGNIRCFLKLAGTPYWPDLTDKVLLLEALGGGEAQIRTYLAQLGQLGAFSRIRGILLGSFTKLETEAGTELVPELVRELVGDQIPIVKTEQIGHGSDASAIWIGKNIRLTCISAL